MAKGCGATWVVGRVACASCASSSTQWRWRSRAQAIQSPEETVLSPESLSAENTMALIGARVASTALESVYTQASRESHLGSEFRQTGSRRRSCRH